MDADKPLLSPTLLPMLLIAFVFHRLCCHRLVTLQSQTCDFAVAGLILQSWSKAKFQTKKDFPNDHF
jgi:hypothetical protein